MSKMKNKNNAMKGIIPQFFYSPSFSQMTGRHYGAEDLTELTSSVCTSRSDAARVGLLPLKSSYMIPNNCLAWGSPEIKSFKSP